MGKLIYKIDVLDTLKKEGYPQNRIKKRKADWTRCDTEDEKRWYDRNKRTGYSMQTP